MGAVVTALLSLVGPRVDWNNDNAGPYSAAEYIAHFESIRTEFPNAKVIASTFDDFVDELATVSAQLPLVTSEIGDTWIHGASMG